MLIHGVRKKKRLAPIILMLCSESPQAKLLLENASRLHLKLFLSLAVFCFLGTSFMLMPPFHLYIYIWMCIRVPNLLFPANTSLNSKLVYLTIQDFSLGWSKTSQSHHAQDCCHGSVSSFSVWLSSEIP